MRSQEPTNTPQTEWTKNKNKDFEYYNAVNKTNFKARRNYCCSCDQMWDHASPDLFCYPVVWNMWTDWLPTSPQWELNSSIKRLWSKLKWKKQNNIENKEKTSEARLQELPQQLICSTKSLLVNYQLHPVPIIRTTPVNRAKIKKSISFSETSMKEYSEAREKFKRWKIWDYCPSTILN